jgi:hypothetical protein
MTAARVISEGEVQAVQLYLTDLCGLRHLHQHPQVRQQLRRRV